MSDTSRHPILIIDDNAADARLIQEAFLFRKINHELHIVSDGKSAIKFLRKEGGFSQAPLPKIILLDLNLPGTSAKEVLREIKTSPEFRRIPVVILTSSDEPRDVYDSYNLRANAFLTKPVDVDSFIAMIGSIETFWLKTVRLPLEE